jgi:hypothetical protein
MRATALLWPVRSPDVQYQTVPWIDSAELCMVSCATVQGGTPLGFLRMGEQLSAELLQLAQA